MVKFEKLEACPIKFEMLKYTEMGNLTEIQGMTRRNTKATIKMLGNDEYLVCSTGEINQIKHHTKRIEQEKNLYKTFKNLRNLINSNITDTKNVRWITLTYKENMTDPKKLYKDFSNFNKRFQYFCNKNEYGKAEYIVTIEPQSRGAYHAHLLYIWEHEAPFIQNETLEKLWGHGFTKIKALKNNIDNVGAYLSAYLADISTEEIDKKEFTENYDITDCKLIEKQINNKTKSIIKGGRLKMYPTNFHIYRTSKGIKRPVSEIISREEVQRKINDNKLTKYYEKTLKLTDTDTSYVSFINVKKYKKKVNHEWLKNNK